MKTLSGVVLVAGLTVGCGDDVASSGGGGGVGQGGAGGEVPDPVVTVLTPDEPPLQGQTECTVTITEGLPSDGQTHVPVCTEVDYATNPPSSGSHWPIWAAYGVYQEPVPREMLVHDLEHGAIVMAHRCEGECPEVLEAFGQVIEGHGVDPLCAVGMMGPTLQSRFILTPDPELAAPIALSAWRATYVATCIDLPSLTDFVADHYGAAPENLCAAGKDPADPETGVPACAE